jgi:arsenate reductase-like glutaredoxin family protein
MTPQLIGTKKSASYRRCERFFKERSVQFQSRDPFQKPLSPQELEAIAQRCGGYEALIDREGQRFAKRGLQWIDYDPKEELQEDPQLLRLPILRSDRGTWVDPGEEELKTLA